MLALTFAKGVVVGLILAVPVGPAGMLCVRRTLIEGVTFGFTSGLGAACADALFGAIAGFGLTFIRDWLLAWRDALGLGGGAFLLVVGLKGLLIPHQFRVGPVGGERLAAAFASTFALAITNPVTILVFAAIFTQIGFDPASGNVSIAVLVAGVFSGSLAWWVSLCLAAPALRRVGMSWLPRFSGALLAVSGMGLLGAAAARLAGLL
ncbi:MAG: LysE family transporter [Alphaproteobacteria bacterium]|nr:LysE family transporter [Alphaproteobacteria bacterium]